MLAGVMALGFSVGASLAGPPLVIVPTTEGELEETPNNLTFGSAIELLESGELLLSRFDFSIGPAAVTLDLCKDQLHAVSQAVQAGQRSLVMSRVALITPGSARVKNAAGTGLHVAFSTAMDGTADGSMAILMHRFDDLPYDRIAHRLGISVKTVEREIVRVLCAIREAREDHVREQSK